MTYEASAPNTAGASVHLWGYWEGIMQPRATLVIRGFIVVLAFAVACAWSIPAVAGTTGGVSGRVIDGATSASIDGARVDVVSPSGSASTTTDAKGHYAFLSLAPDTYTVTAHHDGYETFVERGIT